MKLFFIRHGETMHNRDGIIQGWHDSGLTELGELQARDAGENLKDKKLDAVFTSDLLRTRQTTEEFLKGYGQNIPIFYDWLLRERTFNSLENQSRDSLNWSELFALPDSDWGEIESPISLDDRMISFVKNLKLLPVRFDNIIVITHGGMLNALRRIDGQPDWKKHDNAEIVEYDLDELIGKIERGMK